MEKFRQGENGRDQEEESRCSALLLVVQNDNVRPCRPCRIILLVVVVVKRTSPCNIRSAKREEREREILVRKARTKPTNAMIDSETLPPTTTSPFCLSVEKIRAVSSSRFRNLLFRRLWFIFVVYDARGHRGGKISYTTWTETMGRKPDQLALGS